MPSIVLFTVNKSSDLIIRKLTDRILTGRQNGTSILRLHFDH